MNKKLTLEPLGGMKLVILTIAVSLATLMDVIDATMVNVSVPVIAGGLGASSSQGTWVISSYTLGGAIAIPLTGWIAKNFGEVRIFLIAVSCFAIFSALCSSATDINMIVMLRFFQGLFSAPMVPLSQSLLLACYPIEKRGLGLAVWSMALLSAPIFGPILGGYLSSNYGWQLVFYINIPVGVAAFLTALWIFKGRETQIAKSRVDYTGITLLFVGIGCLQLMLNNGNDYDWFESSFIIGLGLVAAVALIYFTIWSLTDKNPVIDLRLFKYTNFRMGIIIYLTGNGCFFAASVVLSLWLQTTLHYTSAWAGLALAPVGIFSFLLAPLVGTMTDKLNLKAIIGFAFILFSVSMFWYVSFNSTVAFEQLVYPRLLQGIPVALFFIPLYRIMLSEIKNENLAMATGLMGFTKAISASFATALSTYVWSDRQEKHYAHLVEKVNESNFATLDYLQNLASMGIYQPQAYGMISGEVTSQTFTLAFRDFYYLQGVIFLLLILLLWFIKPVQAVGKTSS